MVKVSHAFSYTFKPGADQWTKVSLEISEIDTDLPLDEQIRAADDAVQAIWDYSRNRIDREIEEIVDEVKKGLNSGK